MRAGHYGAAWAIAQATLEARDPASRDDPSLPYHLRWVWDGSDVRGRDVLVRCYHGLGDTIQFARYLPLLAERARSVTIEVQPRLLDLLARAGPIGRLVPFDPEAPLPRSECDIEITELDLALRTPPEAVAIPYLQASRAVLPRGTIGLCHSAGDWVADRSVPANLFKSFCGIASCITLTPAPTALPVLNPKGCPFDIGATASLVAGVDLVITVDTMIAHLAGAMGKPTWLLLKADPDWRWPPRAATSGWYPSMRLYAQPWAGDWTPVVERVARDLAARAERREDGR
ncbi:glycosyltransferase family 9 protein [Sphingomonas gilva]|nr:glycosyltransferase family 9 protein [Sphingomonas gilva]